MYRLTSTPRNLLLTGTILAMAVIAAALLAVAFAGGPVQAQNPGNTYPDPQPCGTGAATAFMEEPHEVTEGRFALFDGYWRATGDSFDGDSAATGVLHTNECPPLMAVTTKFDPNTGQEDVVVTRSARENGMDVDEAIMHVRDEYLATTTATTTGGQLSLQEYPEVAPYVSAGTQVWWLRLDDPDTPADETSDLSLGFSAALLDDQYWLTSEDGKPMRYKFLVERFPTNPGDVPHFFAYKAPKAGGAAAELVWDSTRPGEGAMLLDPGEYEALQWVFTKPGTYVLSVHLEGYVRKINPHKPIDPEYADWKRISGNDIETSEVKRYTIQVGEALDEIEPPIFGVNFSVGENSPGGVKVGDPILVYNADADVLEYELTGDGSENFETTVASTDPHAVQVTVSDGASLDYETRPSYQLTLSVTDNLDHESNPNPYTDDILIVRIDLEDQAPRFGAPR